MLFTDSFYGHAKNLLTAEGIIVTQNGVPFMQPDELRNTMRAFRSLFNDASCYLTHVPSYAGGPMALGWGSMSGKARAVDPAVLQGRFAMAGITTRYYTPDVHKAAFALPGYIASLLI